MKKVIVELTVPQALALRDMALSSDQYNNPETGEYTRTHERALVKLDEAIETIRGEFANRLTDKKPVSN